MWIKNGALLVYDDTLAENADVSIVCPKNALFYLLTNDQENMEKAMQIAGSENLVTLLAENMTELSVASPVAFNIIEP